jgi:hypothetical protein
MGDFRVALFPSPLAGEGPGVRGPLSPIDESQLENGKTFHSIVFPLASRTPSDQNQTPEPIRMSRNSQFRTSHSAFRTLRWLLPFVLAGFCFWQAIPAGHRPKQSTAVASVQPPAVSKAAPATRRKLVTRPIQEIQVGQRVLAENPELRGQDIPQIEIDPETTRLLSLHMMKPDGHELKVETLLPLDSLIVALIDRLESDAAEDIKPLPLVGSEEDVFLNEVLIGHIVEMNLPELGADGPAAITSIHPCPPIEPNDGTGRRLVTSIFRHAAANVLDLYTSGSETSIGVTSNHPFWSEDRQSFIPACELHDGEHLRKANGTFTSVERLVPRAGPQPVFNFEVEGQHVYSVGPSGLLVHNSYLLTSTMHTLDLSNSSWRNTVFSKRGLVYILRDGKTGELLKVGQTTRSRFIGRFEKYVSAGNRTNRSLVLDVFETAKNRGRIEIEVRKYLGGMFNLPWDNTAGRLGRSGPGIPF